MSMITVMENHDAFKNLVEKDLRNACEKEEKTILNDNIDQWVLILRELLIHATPDQKEYKFIQLKLGHLNAILKFREKEKKKAEDERAKAGLDKLGNPIQVRNLDDVCYLLDEILDEMRTMNELLRGQKNG